MDILGKNGAIAYQLTAAQVWNPDVYKYHLGCISVLREQYEKSGIMVVLIKCAAPQQLHKTLFSQQHTA